MDGVFVKRAGATVRNAVGMACGLALAAMPLLVIFSEGRIDKDDILFISAMMICGIVCSLCFASAFFFNRGAYLHLSEDGITGRFAWNTALVCSYRDVAYCEIGIYSLTVRLAGGRRYTIAGLFNAAEICREIRKKMFVFSAEGNVPLPDAINDIRAAKRRRTLWLVLTVGSFALIFMLIFITVLLTGEREMSEFTPADWKIFTVFAVIELMILVFSFFSADRCGKMLTEEKEKTVLMHRSILQTAPPPENAVRVLISTVYTVSAVIFGYPDGGNVYFVIQSVGKDLEPVTVYTSETFENMEELEQKLNLDWYIEIPHDAEP